MQQTGSKDYPVKLDRDVVRTLAAGRSSSHLLKQWPAATRPGGGKVPPPDKATISRWLNGVTFPRSRDELFGLAGALNVDPLALLTLPAEMTWPGLCDAVRAYSWTPQLAPGVQRFWFLRELITPDSEWPSADIARNYFARDWWRQGFLHRTALRRNYYAALLIEPAADAPLQVWHFAWRNRSGMPWRPYGFVRLEQSRVHLCAFDGTEARADRIPGAPFIVETWFGRSDADFCIASLHAVNFSGRGGFSTGPGGALSPGAATTPVILLTQVPFAVFESESCPRHNRSRS